MDATLQFRQNSEVPVAWKRDQANKRVVISDEPRLHVNMPRRGRPEHAISVQNLRRRFTPTQLSELKFGASVDHMVADIRPVDRRASSNAPGR